MPTFLAAGPDATSGSSYFVTVSFFDEIGDAVIPISAKWKLTDGNGAIINNRSDVNIPPIKAISLIVLSGEDLEYQDGGERVLTVEATYNSLNGSNLPLVDSIRFRIIDAESGIIG